MRMWWGKRIGALSQSIAIGRNGAFFNAHRMMRRYAADAYLR